MVEVLVVVETVQEEVVEEAVVAKPATAALQLPLSGTDAGAQVLVAEPAMVKSSKPVPFRRDYRLYIRSTFVYIR